jgi:serine/threonine protein kinase
MCGAVDRTELIFSAVIALPSDERDTYLAQACAGDARLRARLDDMVHAHEWMGHLLDPGIDHTVAHIETLAPGTEHPGTTIAGRYRLLEVIGGGGMGTVWSAEQREPVKRLVAIKLIKAGMDSKAVLARFDAERQALALMDHPNIAKVFDGGTTGAEADGLGPGKPYFVMEMVKGLPLTEYCDARRLSVRDRLALFVQICSAVQHAHQKAVLHRDLKPSNVLVTEHDGRPVPKVIDFGLAKALSVDNLLTDQTLHTAYGTVVGTPLYMAPEQVSLNALDVDTRTDIYALGVMLYELLAGSTPLEKVRFKEAAWDEVRRIIREEEPPRPSTRLSSTEKLASLAACRQIGPTSLTKLVRGELDWIVMKALAKERERRYETANGLGRDIERFLSHEPVLAGPPSASYRVRKFVRRHRGQVIATALLLIALLAGIAGTTTGLIRAEQQRGVAEANERKAIDAAGAERRAREQEAVQRAKAEQARDRTRQALDAMTSTVTGDSLATQREISADQKQFLTEVLKYYQEFAGEEAHDKTSRVRTAAAASRLGKIESRLGRTEGALAAYKMARDGYETLATDFPAKPDYQHELGSAQRGLGKTLTDLGKRSEAADEYRQAQSTLEKLTADFPGAPEYRLDLAGSHSDLGSLLHDLGKQSQAESECRKALAIQEKLATDFPAVAEYRNDLAYSHNLMGILLHDLGKLPQAEVERRKVLEIRKKLVADFPAVPEYRLALAGSHNSLGALLQELGKRPEAQEQHRQAVAIQEKLTSDFPAVPFYRKELGGSYNNLGYLLANLGTRSEAAQAEEHYRKALAIWAKLVADFPTVPEYRNDLGTSHINLGRLLADQGRRSEAENEYRKNLVLQEKLAAEYPAVPERRRRLGIAHNNLGSVLADLQKRSEADAEYHKALAVWEKLAADYPAVPVYRDEHARTHHNLGDLLKDLGKRSEAQEEYRKALVIREKLAADIASVPDYRSNLAETYRNLGLLFADLGNRSEAEQALQRAISIWAQLVTDVPTDPYYRLALVTSRTNQALWRVKAGQVTEAVAELAELAKLPNLDWENWYNFACCYALASGKSAQKKQEYADRAMELLNRAVQAGYKDAAQMKQDAELESLRDRDDFKKLLAKLMVGTEVPRKP